MAHWRLKALKGYLSGWKHQLTPRTGIRVLCYHGLVEHKTDIRLERNFHLISQFKEHVQFFKRLRVWSLDELVHEITSEGQKNLSGVLITFDDGYANNLYAAELLDMHKIPWVLFVTTNSIGRLESLWTVELSLLLLHGQAEVLEILGHPWSLKSRSEREKAFQRIRYTLKTWPADKRRQAMDEIRMQFPFEESRRLLEKFPSLQMLTWEEIGQLARTGVAIGSHGVFHEIHHEAQSKDVRIEELVFSRQIIERKLKRPCVSFAFPNGNFTPASGYEVRHAGYKVGFTLFPSTIQGDANPYLLPRLTAPGNISGLVREYAWRTI